MDSPFMRRMKRSGSVVDTQSPPKGMSDKEVESEFEALLFKLGVPGATRDKMRLEMSAKQQWACTRVAFFLQSVPKATDLSFAQIWRSMQTRVRRRRRTKRGATEAR